MEVTDEATDVLRVPSNKKRRLVLQEMKAAGAMPGEDAEAFWYPTDMPRSLAGIPVDDGQHTRSGRKLFTWGPPEVLAGTNTYVWNMDAAEGYYAMMVVAGGFGERELLLMLGVRMWYVDNPPEGGRAMSRVKARRDMAKRMRTGATRARDGSVRIGSARDIRITLLALEDLWISPLVLRDGPAFALCLNDLSNIAEDVKGMIAKLNRSLMPAHPGPPPPLIGDAENPQHE